MDTVEFVKNWKIIDSVLTKAQLEFGTNIPLKDFIDTVEKEEIVNTDEWREALKIWKRNDDTLQEIKQTLEKHSLEISNIEGEEKEHSLKISNIESEMKKLSSEISQHNVKISNIEGEVKKHSSEILQQNVKISNIEGEEKKHSLKISNIESEVKEHSSEILQQNVKISNIEGEVKEHSSEISQQNVKISNIEGEEKEHSLKISNIEGEEKEHSLKISNIEGEVKEHSLKISNIEGEEKEHNVKISNIDGEEKEHSLKISNIESEVKEHSSEISQHNVKFSNIEGEIIYLRATIGQKRSISSEGSNGDSASGSIKKKRQQKYISSARVKRGSSDSHSGSFQKKKSKHEVNIPAFDKQDLSELQTCLVEYYTKYYMKSLVTATASSGCETYIDDIYAEPGLMLVNQRAHGKPNLTSEIPTSGKLIYENPTMDNKVFISLRDIFPNDKNKCYNIYITGEAGKGKTSLCQFILSSWCKACRADEPNDYLEMALKQYDFLFYVSLRTARDQHDIQDMIVSQLLEYIASNNELLSRFKPKSLLQNLFKHSSRKCLIILDGLDEWTTKGRSNMPFISDGVPERDFNLKYTIMTTTRPWKLEELRLKDSEIDRQIEIYGVESISTFAEKLITFFNTKLNEKKAYKDFDKCLSEAGLIKMQTIPILLKYLICLWFDKQNFGKSKTEVYTNIIDLCFENAEKREGVKNLCQPRHISTDTPGVFKGKEKCNKYMDILKAVGKLAFETAMDPKGMQLAFNSTDDLTDDQIQICLNVGILTQSTVPSIVCKEKSISFLHKTFHEYFAALYMGWLSSIPEEKFRLTKTNIYEREDFFYISKWDLAFSI